MSSDILDVLSISGRSNLSNQKKKITKDGPTKKKKQTAMSRELFNLIGQNTPPLAVEKTVKFKEKLNVNNKPTPWSYVEFSNDARESKDGLKLHHWIKGSSELAKNSPYLFEKYNQKIQIPSFTKEEYDEFLKDLDLECREREKRDKALKEQEAKEAEKLEKEKENDKERVNGDELGKEEDNASDFVPKKENVNDQILPKIDEPQTNKKDDMESTEDVSKSDSQEVSKDVNPSEEVEASWDYDETVHLFQLCEKWDLRWPIIVDRYEYDERSMEELKERFYKVSERILRHKYRNVTMDDKTSLLVQTLSSFDKRRETERKQYLRRLLSRSPTEIAEEESLVIEARKFELAAKKMLTERASLLRLLDSPQSTGSISQYLTSQGLTQLYNTLMSADRSKRRKVETPTPPQIPPGASSSLHRTSMDLKRKAAKKIGPNALLENIKATGNSVPPSGNAPQSAAIELINTKMTPEEKEAYGIKIHQEKLQPGVSLRSARLPTFKPATQAKIVVVLNELEVSPKPTIPTAKVVAQYDNLLQTINVLLETKKQVNKLEVELNLLEGKEEDKES
ncbi:SWR1-complex protein 4 [Komagataella phaffii CBS 7435]|uniref:SWR1-complex protein 4 n=2 Tax=Komagataella phaffii TaxID=460519 RepID=C4R0G7_KOMPG|nr:Component of the Swr1p complex that incorporates Htz1p into chromatin [Komagataella phaffii GS115]7ZVW_F Chain F, SWR1-complex protein 4 [Komagataella phaffii GS115]AOA63077.1 GQ67_00409T0 [Komagataella phaffii]CAH2448492.1 SWR1-complex protein 4 [Komagataella phaffii CBS 7435]AOA67259.1 GQ68_00980T0 [Komagataella phaffii GS115]CAY68991.1 Component of the Swr1p complex that incorporates Htz1p into chromatin [Komagataella phaffii GS115]CCA38611.1 SWR1-complex protein 4 [Komagataella phaffii